MTSINGDFFEANVSSRIPATITISPEGYSLHSGENQLRSGRVEDFTVSERIGNTARRLQWIDGALFETTENDALDSVLRLHPKAIRGGMAHRLESNWSIALGSVAFVGIVIFSLFKWGIPAAAHNIASRLPVTAHELVSTGALKSLDQFIFSPTALNTNTQSDVQDSFASMIETLDGTEFNYRLHFRKMHGMPNAMALPSGEIIVSDAFVELASKEELEAVLLHELGHVEERHGMEQVINASAVSVIISTALGNLGGVNELVAGVPVFLLQSSYSRKNESAADAFAFNQMARAGIDPIHFATVIRKLGTTNQRDSDSDDTTSYLSSHPGTEQRAQRAMEASRRFNSTR